MSYNNTSIFMGDYGEEGEGVKNARIVNVSNQRMTIENVPCVNENESMVKVNNEGPEVQQSCDFELSKDRCILIGLRGNRKPIHIFESIQEMPLWKVLKYQQ